jgi:cysteine desulfuration protein SufE
MSIAVKEAEIIEEFEMLDNWQDRFQIVIDTGETLPAMPEELKVDQNRVFLSADLDGEVLHFYGHSEAQIPRGLLTLLIRVVDGEKPQDIVQAQLGFFDKAGIKDNLSMQRAVGLESMIKRIKLEAAKYVKN